MNELSIKFFRLHTKHSVQLTLHIFILFIAFLNRTRSTRSSSLVTLNRPSNPSHLQITKTSFYHMAPALWNSLPPAFRQAPESSTSPLAISPTLFHKKLKSHLFHSSFPL